MIYLNQIMENDPKIESKFNISFQSDDYEDFDDSMLEVLNEDPSNPMI
jgi:hypothetical protein